MNPLWSFDGKHSKNVHRQKLNPVIYDVSKWNFKCLENGCNNSFQHNEGLTRHLTEHHGLKIEYETLEFSAREGMVWVDN